MYLEKCITFKKNNIQEPAGVMLDVAVSFRDPTFYRWHKYIDDMYDANKQRLRPYTPTGVR